MKKNYDFTNFRNIFNLLEFVYRFYNIYLTS